MIVIGIDPGQQTGFAQYEDGKLTRLWTFKPLQAIAYLQMQDEGLFIMEDSRLQTVNYHGKDHNKSVIFTVGRRVGTVDSLCGLYEDALGKNMLIRLSPLAKGAKVTNSDGFCKMTGWNGASNQHERDAAMVAWNFRNGAR
jgi:hypothetical protein